MLNWRAAVAPAALWMLCHAHSDALEDAKSVSSNLPSISSTRGAKSPVTAILVDMDEFLFQHIREGAGRAYLSIPSNSSLVVIPVTAGNLTQFARAVDLEHRERMGLLGFGPGVYCDGGIVIGPRGKRLVDRPLDTAETDCALDAWKDLNVLKSVLGQTDYSMETLTHNDAVLEIFREYNVDTTVVTEFKPNRYYTLYCIRQHDVESIFAELRTRCGHLIRIKKYKTIIEVTPKPISKLDSMLWLLKAMDVSLNQIAVVGSAANDLELVKHAAISFAVGSAHSKVRDAAKYIVPMQAHDGLSEAIRFVQRYNEQLRRPNPDVTVADRLRFEE